MWREAEIGLTFPSGAAYDPKRNLIQFFNSGICGVLFLRNPMRE